MFAEMTPAVERALEAAQRHARHAGSPEVLPLHLLHGLLEEDEGRAVSVSSAAGLEYQAYRQQVSDPSASESTGRKSLQLHSQTVQVLRLARELAVDLTGERTIASEILLLAVLRGDALALGHLEQFGFN